MSGGRSSKLMPATRPEWVRQIEEHLWPKGSRRDVWMIVDAARDSQIYGLLLEYFYSQHTCLFSGSLAPELQVVSPYLVQLDYEDKETRFFIRRAWSNSWGVFLKCDTRLETLKRHLHTLLVIPDETGKRLLFRYYDPRILRSYLLTCTADELHTVFGPIDRFFVEEENSGTLLEFCMDKNKLIATKVSLTS